MEDEMGEIDAVHEAAPTAVAAAPHAPRAEPLVVERLLNMADHCMAGNLFRQAAEMYFEILERHGDSHEREHARRRLLEIAQHYENNGNPHQARGIYERLV